MQKSNLIEAFRSFTPQEIKEFTEFVTSPFFNKNVNVIKLFDVIKKNYPEFDEEKIEKEKVFKKIFPGKPYKDSTMRLLMFYLYEVVEKFLAYSRFANNSMTFNQNLTAELRQRGLFKEFEKNIEKINNEIENLPVKDEDFYMNRFIFRYEYLSYMSNYLDGKYEKSVSKDDIEFISQNLTYFYLIRILKFYSIALNMMYLYNVKIETMIFENIMQSFNPDAFKHVPMIGVYYNTIMILLKPEEESYYFNLKELVIKNEANLPAETISDLYINLENYCHRKSRTVRSEKFLQEALQIYNLELQNKVCFYNGLIPYSFYNSYVVTACRLSEFEIAEDFIENYKKNLSDEYREGYYQYTKAFLEDARGQHEKALEYLSKVKLDDMYMKMDVRVLLCKIYFELGWQMPLQSLLDTFKKTVQNNKLMPDIRKKYFLQFIRYLNQLNNLSQKQDKSKADEILSQLETEEYFPNKIWLEAKATSLLNQ